MLTQDRHLADDLLHPQRREPGVLLRHMRQRFDHHRQRQHRVLRMVDKDAADVVAQRHKALLNQLRHQRIPRTEIVMQHRRRYPGLFGDGVQRHAGRTVAGKQRQGDVHQLFAVGGTRFFSTRSPRAAGGILILLCCHDMAIS